MLCIQTPDLQKVCKKLICILVGPHCAMVDQVSHNSLSLYSSQAMENLFVQDLVYSNHVSKYSSLCSKSDWMQNILVLFNNSQNSSFHGKSDCRQNIRLAKCSDQWHLNQQGSSVNYNKMYVPKMLNCLFVCFFTLKFYACDLNTQLFLFIFKFLCLENRNSCKRLYT